MIIFIIYGYDTHLIYFTRVWYLWNQQHVMDLLIFFIFFLFLRNLYRQVWNLWVVFGKNAGCIHIRND